ncbi:MAG TPA: FtsX-like permease family protein [Acidimicrobiales bacterium]|nr:FtsX-like permease family protein [Acidimicrobiales bacterium]
MFNLTRKGLWAHKVRFMLTGLAVVLGVAFMSGTMILTDTIGKTFDGLFETTNEGIDVVVRRTAGIEGEFADVQERVDATVLEQVRAVDGVDAAAGSVQGFAQLVGADGTAITSEGVGGTMGMAWIDDERLNPFHIWSGRTPAGPSEIVLDQRTLESQGWSIGDTVGVLGRDATVPMTIVGTVTFGELKGISGFSVIGTDPSTAQAMFAQPGTYDAVVVAAEDGTSADDLAARITAAIGSPELEVITGDADTDEKQAAFREDMSFFSTFLLAFAYIALFVGMFIIYNTFSIIIAQRMREMAMLRAVGASRRQVLGAVLLESVMVGAVSAAVGLGAGVLMSLGLRGLLATAGLELPGGDVVITGKTIVTAFAVGLSVTLLSSVGPAVRASRIRPIAALRDTAVERTTASLRRTVLGLVVLGAGVVGFATGVTGSGSGAMRTLGLGMLLALLGMFVLGPVIARPVMHALGFPTKLSGAVGNLARENAKRNPRRSAATASALMIGVALVAFITILASSSKASTAEAVDRSLRADFVIDSGSWGVGGFGPSIEAAIAALPEVELLSPFRSVPATVDGRDGEVLSVDTAVVEGLMDLEVTAGAIADVTGDGIALSTGKAAELGVGLGGTVTASFSATGDVPLTVRAVFDGDILGAGATSYIVGLDTFEANVTDVYDRKVFVTTHDGVDAATSYAAIDAALAGWPNAELQDQASFKESITKEIDMMLNLIYGLLALAVIIALIGIANTLALSVHERTRELGLLRAVGMTRRQLKTAIRWESVLISLLGTGLGFLLGFGGAWGITQTMGDEVTTFVVPGGQLTVILALAAFAGVVAALGPARRAARLNVLEAIATS